MRNYFFTGMILILAWEVGFTQAQVWALAWEACLFQDLALILAPLDLEVGFVLDLALILALDLEVDFFKALALILTLVWKVGFFQVLDLMLALAWEVGFFQVLDLNLALAWEVGFVYYIRFPNGNMNPMSTIQVLFFYFFLWQDIQIFLYEIKLIQ